MTTGEKIRALRKEKGWSQDELARRIGYTSRSTINKIELNINDITQSTIKKIATVFNIDPCELITEEPINMEALYEKWDSELSDQTILEVRILDKVSEVFGKDAALLLSNYIQLSAKDRPKANDYLSDLVDASKFRKEDES